MQGGDESQSSCSKQEPGTSQAAQADQEGYQCGLGLGHGVGQAVRAWCHMVCAEKLTAGCLCANLPGAETAPRPVRRNTFLLVVSFRVSSVLPAALDKL